MRSLRPYAIVLAAIAGVMLLATLVYPFGYDQSVYAVGGDMVLHGKIPYRDFLDTKQPLIFYIYALSQFVFGRHEYSIHILDVLYQLAAAYYFYRILRRDLSVEISIAAAALTIILYAASGFWMSCEAESFAILPSLWLIDVTFSAAHPGPLTPSRIALRLGIVAGTAAVILFLLKFTLVLGALPAILFILIRRIHPRIKRSYLMGFAFSFIFWIGLNILYQWWVGGLHPFIQSLGWLWQYGKIGNDQHSLFSQLFWMFPIRIIYSSSIALFLLGIAGIIIARKRQLLAFRKSLISLLLFTGFIQLLGVLLERKIEFPYQYTRALWAFTPFMALGLFAFLEMPKTFRAFSRTVRNLIVGVFILIFLPFSPLIRIASQTVPWSQIAFSQEDAEVEVQHRIPDYFPRDQKMVTTYLNSRFQPNDQLFFWGNDVEIYFRTNRIPTTPCLTATPFRTTFTPKEWKTNLLTALEKNPPKFFISESGDAKPYITGNKLDSYQSLLQWNDLELFLNQNYSLDTTIGHFLVFRTQPH